MAADTAPRRSPLRTLLRVVVLLLGAVLVAGFGLWAVHTWNSARYLDPGPDPRDRTMVLNQLSVVPVDGDYLRGAYFEPAVEEPRPGTIVIFGGSEGGANTDQAADLRDLGHHVLALHFFGQEGQPEELVEVPLDFFDEVLDWVGSQGRAEEPLTVIGLSKGAELTANLAVRYPQIDNIVLYSPTDHTYAGLSFQGEQRSSFTWQGEPVPFAPFPTSFSDTFPMTWRFLLGLPVSFRATHEQAEREAPPEARIDLGGFAGRGLLFAGTEDAMWQSDVAARSLAAQNPRLEAVLFDDAGHLLSPDVTVHGRGWHTLFGGTVEGSRRAKEESDDRLGAALASWHGEGGN